MSLILRIALLIIFSFPGISLAYANKLSTVKLVSQVSHIPANSEFYLALKFDLPQQFHSYWLNPAEAGMETSVIWQENDDFSISELLWPVPTKIIESGLVTYGYDNDFVLLAKVKTKNIKEGKIYNINGLAEWLICKDICLPYSQKIKIKFQGAAQKLLIHDFSKYLNKIPNLETKKVKFNYDQSNLWLELDKKQFYFHNSNIDFFPEKHNIVDYKSKVKLTETSDKYYLTLGLSETDKINNFSAVIKEEINFWRVNLSHTSNLPLPKENKPLIVSKFFIFLAFAFFGGVILNLMPCVFPVLSLKALHIAQTAHKNPSKIKLEAFGYTAGVIISFLLLSLIIILLKQIGYGVGWGFQMQSPLFVIILTMLFFIIGLNLLGLFEVGNKFVNFGHKLIKPGSNSSSFFTGALATIVATPCSAPFMASALGFALAQDAFVVAITFIFLGLGLSFPILVLAFFPQASRILPRPGKWLDNFKLFLSFPIFLTVVWLLFVLSGLTEIFNIFWLLILLVLLSFNLCLLVKIKGLKILKITSILFFLYFSQEFYQAVTTEIPTSETELARLPTDKKLELIKNNRKIGNKMFVNVTADWCITCKINEQAAINPLLAKEFFSKNNVKYIKLDWTRSDEAITEFLADYERSGVPLYIYFDENGTAELLPQLLTPAIVKNVLMAETSHGQ